MISFVYFDLGGVVALDLVGTVKWTQLKREIGISAENDAEFDAFWKIQEPLALSGRDVDSFMPLIEEKFNVRLPDHYSLLIDGYVKRFELNKSIWPVIAGARQKYKIGLLTNMYPRMLDAIKERGLLPDVKWDAIVDSSVVGAKKPDPGIFEIAEQKAAVTGKDIMFVDNSAKNVKAAEDFGWQAFFYFSSDPEGSSGSLSNALALSTTA